MRISYRKVAVKEYLKKTISERQGQIREDLHEGSPEQSCEPTPALSQVEGDRNIIEGLEHVMFLSGGELAQDNKAVRSNGQSK